MIIIARSRSSKLAIARMYTARLSNYALERAVIRSAKGAAGAREILAPAVLGMSLARPGQASRVHGFFRNSATQGAFVDEHD
jgi:hypothetical protein